MLLATWHGKFQRHDSSDEEKTSLDTFILLSAVSTYLLWLSFIICRDFNRGIQVQIVITHEMKWAKRVEMLSMECQDVHRRIFVIPAAVLCYKCPGEIMHRCRAKLGRDSFWDVRIIRASIWDHPQQEKMSHKCRSSKQIQSIRINQADLYGERRYNSRNVALAAKLY